MGHSTALEPLFVASHGLSLSVFGMPSLKAVVFPCCHSFGYAYLSLPAIE